MGVECRAMVAGPLVVLVIQGVDVGQMFFRKNAFGYRFCPAEIVQGLGFVVHRIGYTGQGDECIQGMPLVFRVLHQLIGGLILADGLVILVCFFVKRTEIVMAECHSERVVRPLVVRHRQVIVHPSRVGFSLLLED